MVLPVNGTEQAKLNFILVADDWHRRGIATKLISACRERWPQLMFAKAVNPVAVRLLKTIDQPTAQESVLSESHQDGS